MSREDKIQEIVERCMRLQRPASHDAWKGLGLSHAQISMLFMLYFHKNTSVKKVAMNLDVSTSAVTQLVDPLIKKGMVLRENDPNDRRIARLSLTTKGTDTIKKMKKIKSAGFRAALEHLSIKEIDDLDKITQKMILKK